MISDNLFILKSSIIVKKVEATNRNDICFFENVLFADKSFYNLMSIRSIDVTGGVVTSFVNSSGKISSQGDVIMEVGQGNLYNVNCIV